MADAVAVGAVLNAASLGSETILATSMVTVPSLGFGMRPRGPRIFTDAANLGHHVRRSDSGVEVDLALLNLGDELVGTDDVGAGSLTASRACALGEDGNTNGLAGAVGQGDGTTDVLVSLTVSMPRRKWASTVSSNLAVSSSLMSLAASSGVKRGAVDLSGSGVINSYHA